MYKGWTTMYYAIAGANIGYLRELMTALFGEVEKEEVFAEGQFEDVTTWKQKREADATFADSGKPSKKKVYAFTLPIPMELGVPLRTCLNVSKSWKRRIKVMRL